MSLRGFSLVLAQVVSGVSICWMKNDSGDVSVIARVPESSLKNSSESSSKELADKAKNLAIREAGKVGTVLSAGVYMGGDGKGNVSATGTAVLSWTPEIEKKLCLNGLHQVV